MEHGGDPKYIRAPQSEEFFDFFQILQDGLYEHYLYFKIIEQTGQFTSQNVVR